MAKKEQLSILAQGAQIWNQWRSENVEVAVNLSTADLSAVDLDGVNLQGADLKWAKFKNASLRKANFAGAEMFMAQFLKAHCMDAKFGKANLKWADFSGAYLNDADFSMAFLEGTKFRKAFLAGATFDRALLKRASFSEATLDGASLRHVRGEDSYFEGASLWRAILDHAELPRANLQRANLKYANLRGAILTRADLSGNTLRDPAWLTESLTDYEYYDVYEDEEDGWRDDNEDWISLESADLCHAVLEGAHLERANLSDATLVSADLTGANLTLARLIGTDLTGSNLQKSILVETDFDDATLSGSNVYGASAWGIRGTAKEQLDLCITPSGESEIHVDDLEVAQFIYLLLNNEKLRHVIDAITSESVLILGRFSEKRKPTLDALRDALREKNLAPIVFDFSIPAIRDVTETIRILAGMARFVLADITDATEVRVELHNIVPDFPSLPVQPLLLAGKEEFVSLTGHLQKFPWLLPTFEYRDVNHLLKKLDSVIKEPLEQTAKVRIDRKR